MNKQYICIEHVEGLTVGASYHTHTKASGHIYLCVTNDEGQYQDVDRKHLEPVKE